MASGSRSNNRNVPLSYNDRGRRSGSRVDDSGGVSGYGHLLQPPSSTRRGVHNYPDVDYDDEFEMSDDYQSRLANYSETLGRPGKSQGKAARSESPTVDAKEAELIQLMAMQMYHLPEYTWCEDWKQYMANNHPVFGICFHHELHPIKACTRVVALLGSAVFGIMLTSMFELFYVWNPQFNQEVFTLVTSNEDEWSLSTGMVLLWTLGGAIHTAYNLLIWHIAACMCCRPGGCCESRACCPSFGKHLLRVFVVITIGMAALIVLMRVAIANSDDGTGTSISEQAVGGSSQHGGGSINFQVDDAIQKLHVEERQEYHFLIGYVIEMVLALFVYYPFGGTILFSGVLGCGRIPLLGGRPYEVRAEERKLKRLAVRKGESNIDQNIEIGTNGEVCEVEHVRVSSSHRRSVEEDVEVPYRSSRHSRGRR